MKYIFLVIRTNCTLGLVGSPPTSKAKNSRLEMHRSIKHHKVIKLFCKAALGSDMVISTPILLSILLGFTGLTVGLTPGSYTIANVQFSEHLLVGSDNTAEGLPVYASNVSLSQA